MSLFADAAPAFVEMAHRIVWCTVATVDSHGRPRSDAKAVRLLANVFMRMPNHATEYEPRMPTTDHIRISP